MPEPYDCQTCGACCVDATGTHGYVRLTERGATHFRCLDLLVIDEPGESFLGTRADAEGRDVCCALTGTVAGPCSCSVYPSRPWVCRAFEPGGVGCREVRKTARLPV